MAGVHQQPDQSNYPKLPSFGGYSLETLPYLISQTTWLKVKLKLVYALIANYTYLTFLSFYSDVCYL